MARPKSATHDLKRDAILDIAAKCFAERSYPAATMNEIATACGTSKARLYHYYDSKDAILFDLLDRHTQRLLALIAQTEAKAQRLNLDDRAALHALVRAFLNEYETSATRHAALLNDTKFLSDEPDPALDLPPLSPRALIVSRQRDIVAAMTRFMKRAYPGRLTPANQTAMTMMLLGMINWTFTWLRPGGPMRYADFAEEVVRLIDQGLAGAGPEFNNP
jgi:AcrR family transcriptional regulator